MDPISDIKNRLPIEQLVSQYVQLKRVGRSYKALCPFHKERTPSFHVSPEKQLAYCFGCHKGGDHFKFIEEIEGLDFVGALKFLAEKTGVNLPKIQPQDKAKKTERDRLIEIHEKAADFYEKSLWDSSEGKPALAYLKKRGFEKEVVKREKLGFAPETGRAVYSYLLDKGFTREEILVSGLAMARDTEKSECVDRFRNRLMFPIRNLAGNVCAFGGRSLREGDEPKYLNSPETPVYHKSSLLYGLSEARPEIRNKNFAIIVEGYMDVLSVKQAGIFNVAACSGAALTESQLVLLKRFTPNAIFSFDRDEAGKTATQRAIELALKQEMSAKVAVWDSKAKDPDECVRSDKKLYAESIENAASAISYLISEAKAKFDTRSIEGKKKLLDAILPFILFIQSPIEVDAWMKNLSALVDISVSSIYDEMKRLKNKPKIGQKPLLSSSEEATDNSKKSGFKTAEYIIGIILTYPEIYGLIHQLIQPGDFDDIELQNIYRAITTQYNQSLDDTGNRVEQLNDFIHNNLSDEQRARANLLSMFAESHIADMAWDALEREVLSAVEMFLKQKLDGEKRNIVRQLREKKEGEKTRLLEIYQDLLAREEKSRQSQKH